MRKTLWIISTLTLIMLIAAACGSEVYEDLEYEPEYPEYYDVVEYPSNYDDSQDYNGSEKEVEET